jgi:hypothetical protein
LYRRTIANLTPASSLLSFIDLSTQLFWYAFGFMRHHFWVIQVLAVENFARKNWLFLVWLKIVGLFRHMRMKTVPGALKPGLSVVTLS